MTFLSKPFVDAIARALRGVRTGPASTWKGLSVVPLIGGSPDAPVYRCLPDVVADGSFRITEVSEAGSVPELEAYNERPQPVLILDGEELVGAKQNRIVNVSILVPGETTITIPVSCVEQGRWAYSGREFRDSDRTLYARARARKTRDVNRSYRRGGRTADQGAIWDNVRDRMEQLGVASPTLSMSDGFEARADRIEEYVAAMPTVPGQVGAVFAIAGKLAGIELFDAPESFLRYHPKLVRSYALDALLHDAAGEPPGIAEEDVERALAGVAECPCQSFPGVGLGEDVRLEGTDMSGGALVHNGTVIHLAAFWADGDAPNGKQGPQDRAASRDNTLILRSLLAEGAVRMEPGPFLSSSPAPLRRPDLWNRVEGMLLGLAIGDSLGNTTEGLNPGERRAHVGEVRDYLPHRYAQGRRVGLPSDDTQLAFWTLDRLNRDGGLVPENLLHEFARRRIFGIGRTVRGALRRYTDEHRPWQEAGLDSAGNGALMRIAPVLIPHLAAPSSGLWADATLATMITHNDSAVVASSVAFVQLLWDLLGRSRVPEPRWWVETFAGTLKEIEGGDTRYRTRTPHVRFEGPLWRFVEEHVTAAEDRSEAVQEACDRWYSGAYLLETVPSLLYILSRYGHDPEEAIVRAVNDTMDNDSIAAMVGAAVGALHGRERLPQRWVEGLLGRTGEADDGAVFQIIEDARRRWEVVA